MNKEQAKERSLANLSQYCLSEFTFECSKCGKVDKIMDCDEIEAAESQYEDGWRATDNATYCPKCAKKYRIK